MAKEKQAKKTEEKKMIVGTRGRTFQGYVIKKFDRRAVVEFERIIHYKKFERYAKDKTRLHARIPEGIEVHVGDYVEIRECRPLSKIIHFVVVKLVRRAEK